MDRRRRIEAAFACPSVAARLSSYSLRESVLRKKFRKEKGRSEWALLDSEGEKVLRWFGERRPSDDRVEKEERRVQYFKHRGSSRVSFVRPMAYGTLPSREEFDMAFELEVPGGLYQIRGPRGDITLPVPDGDYSSSELWEILSGAVGSREEDRMSLASCILGTLGFEWR